MCLTCPAADAAAAAAMWGREDAGSSGPLAAPGREARLPRPRPPLDTDAEECCPYSPSYSFSCSHPRLGSIGMRSMSLVDEAKEGRGVVKGAVAAAEPGSGGGRRGSIDVVFHGPGPAAVEI